MKLGRIRWKPSSYLWLGGALLGMLVLAGVRTRLISSWDLILGTAAISVIISLWILPKWQVRHLRAISDEERFDRENEARKTLAQIIGGLLAVGGILSAALSFSSSVLQTTNSMAQLRLANDGQVDDRLMKATEQLGASRLEVRLAAISVLGSIDAGWHSNSVFTEKESDAVTRILVAYIRSQASLGEPHDEHESAASTPREKDGSPLAPDIQASLDVLGRYHDKVNLGGTNLNGADMRGADFRGASFIGSALRKSRLAKANLSEADLSRADLTGADLTGVDFDHAALTGTILDGADLSDAISMTQQQLDSARGNDDTRLPHRLSQPGKWPGLLKDLRDLYKPHSNPLGL
jgi:Pentapeptide repeats (8 copies)